MFAESATRHEVGLVAMQSPPHVTSKPASGVAVRTTVVKNGNSAEQVEPQEIPAGRLVTVPCPELTTWSVDRRSADDADCGAAEALPGARSDNVQAARTSESFHETRGRVNR